MRWTEMIKRELDKPADSSDLYLMSPDSPENRRRLREQARTKIAVARIALEGVYHPDVTAALALLELAQAKLTRAAAEGKP